MLRRSSSLPPGDGRAAHCGILKETIHVPVYMALQPIRRAAYHVTMVSGGLLPHLFTISFIMRNKGCYFLSRYSAVTDSSLLESMVLCVARTFLLPLRLTHRQATRPSCYRIQNYKLYFNSLASELHLLYFYTQRGCFKNY